MIRVMGKAEGMVMYMEKKRMGCFSGEWEEEDGYLQILPM